MKLGHTIALTFCVLANPFQPLFAQNWAKTGSSQIGWGCVACSADGTHLVGGGSGVIYTSTNSGITWAPTISPSSVWQAAASSADGTKLAMVGGGSSGVLYTSTNSGATWANQTNAPVISYISIASSADGTKLETGGDNSFLYRSTNSGITWTTNDAPQGMWNSIASSADGQRWFAADGSGSIYASTNFGMTWVTNNVPQENWESIAASVDGKKLIAATGDTSIFTSTNGGKNWASNAIPSGYFVASSADGNTLVAAESREGVIYASTNSGNTWTSNGAPWISMLSFVSSADGTKMFAAGDYVYTWQNTPSPRLHLESSEAYCAVSWLVASTNFALQQNADSGLMNWTTLTNRPTLDLTNLQDEVYLSPKNRSCFYRLIAQ
jgi:photosystem II stability/assembly factor-like uncharacterized protein